MKWRELISLGIPITQWLPSYPWKDALLDDFINGTTVATLVIPQSMAYALLAGLPAQYGLYTAVLPPLIYGIFGTSKHLQIGACYLYISLIS